MIKYTELAITNEITGLIGPLHEKLFTINLMLLTVTFILALVWRFLENVFGKKNNLMSEVLKLMMIYLSLISLNIFFPQIIATANFIADQIMTPAETINFVQEMWDSKEMEESMDVGVFDFNLGGIVAAITAYAAVLSIIIINKLRLVLLSVYYGMMPLVGVLCMLPLYDGKLIMGWLKEVIQISTWPIFVSFLLYLLQNMGVNMQSGQNLFLDSIPNYVIIIITIVGIPKLAAAMLQGSDFTFMAAAAFAASGAAKGFALKATGVSKVAGKAMDKAQDWSAGKIMQGFKKLRS